LDKKVIALLVLLLCLLLVGCSANDPLTERFYTTGLTNTDGLTTDTLTADNITTDTLVVNDSATYYDQIVFADDGRIWLEFRAELDFVSVRANGAPTWVTRGVFGGFSLPVGGANEELQFECCVPDRWCGSAWEKLGDVGDKPGGMAVNDGILYIPCEGDDTVWAYDGTDLSISGTVGDAPVYATTHNGNVYVSCAGDDTVWVYSGGVWSKSGDVGSSPEGMVSDGADLYVACRLDDEIWRLSGGVWAVDPALGLGGVAGAVGTSPYYMASYGGDIYVGCAGVDDDVWIRSGGAWAKDDDVGDEPSEFHEHDGDLFLNCENDDTVWFRTGGAWAVTTNVMTDIGNAPIGMEEFHNNLYSACKNSVWSNKAGFWNVNSDFSIVTADEPMFLKVYDDKLYTSCYASDTIWVFGGETASVNVHVWLTDAQVNATDALRLYLEHATFTPDDDIVPIGSDGCVKEVLTGVAPQFQTYELHIPLDMTGVEGDDSLAFRLTRIASSDEIAGEVVIQHIGVLFKCDKLGNLTP